MQERLAIHVMAMAAQETEEVRVTVEVRVTLEIPAEEVVGIVVIQEIQEI